MDKRVFLENLNNMYEGMLKVGPDSDIWQNELIYNICKASYDTIKEMLREHSDESKGN